MLPTRRIIVVFFMLMTLVAWPLIVQAGGWAVVTLDALPVGVTVDEPFTAGFMVRQHGLQPTPGLDLTVTAVHAQTGQSTTFEAVERGKVGHYLATITLPLPGRWQWQVNTWGNTSYPMPDLEVSSPAAAPTGSKPAAAPYWPVLLGLVAALGLGAALFLWRRRRRPWAIGMAAATIIIGLIGLGALIAGGETAGAKLASAQSAPAQDTAGLAAPAEQGQRLFLAKGCLTCHHYEGQGTGSFSTGIGPNLTHYGNDPAFLDEWLSDPKAVKPNTRMPDLDLSQEEIQALIAFLNDDQAAPAP